jgi:hypothetical protein
MAPFAQFQLKIKRQKNLLKFISSLGSLSGRILVARDVTIELQRQRTLLVTAANRCIKRIPGRRSANGVIIAGISGQATKSITADC